VEGDVRDYHDYRHHNAGRRQDEGDAERYYSGRGPRDSGRAYDEPRRSSSSRGGDTRRRE
jgi:hypothetical protein